VTDLTSHLEKLEQYLAPFKRNGVLNHINGVATAAQSGDTFNTHSPTDESLICAVARSGDADVDAAALAAKEAFPAWRDLPANERKKILIRIAENIEARAEEIALCECWDTGQAFRFMSKAALRGAENFRYFADQVSAARDGKNLRSPTLMNVTTRVPIGPVGIITPWNTPFMLSTWKIAPALAAGCTVVHKPAELSPITARLLMDIATEAGLPPGVWNLVNGYGEDTGKALTEHPAIKAIAFVGESRTGSLIAKQSADTLKRVHFELGGKNPVIVFDDADLDRALDAVIFMIYSINGERCTSSSRLLIQENIRETFEAKLVERVNKIKVGHPLDPTTEIGPLIAPEHFKKVTSYFDIAKQDGATIAAGGEQLGESGYFVKPTLFTSANNAMRISQEEIFGPVLTSIPFADEAEALTIANDTPYGLTAYVVKASGIGRDGGDWSFEFYMEQKHVGFALGQHKIPRLGV